MSKEASRAEGAMSNAAPLKYFAKGKQVFLSGALPEQEPKLICVATSKRLAEKIRANMNLMESRKQREHEHFMCGKAVRNE